MWNFVTMIIFMFIWRGKRVTFYQQGKVISIGTVKLITDSWMHLADVQMAGGRRVKRFAVSRNRIDGFWEFVQGDEQLLVHPHGAVARPVEASPKEPQKEDEEEEGG